MYSFFLFLFFWAKEFYNDLYMKLEHSIQAERSRSTCASSATSTTPRRRSTATTWTWDSGSHTSRPRVEFFCCWIFNFFFHMPKNSRPRINACCTYRANRWKSLNTSCGVEWIGVFFLFSLLLLVTTLSPPPRFVRTHIGVSFEKQLTPPSFWKAVGRTGLHSKRQL